MHQLLCGVEDSIVVDGYCVQVLEVTPDAVRIGISTRGNQHRVHEIQLPAADRASAAPRPQVLTGRPAAN